MVQLNFHKKQNENQKYTIFFVDESSMISDNKKSNDSFITKDSLLKDLIIYVKQGNNKNKIVSLETNSNCHQLMRIFHLHLPKNI